MGHAEGINQNIYQAHSALMEILKVGRHLKSIDKSKWILKTYDYLFSHLMNLTFDANPFIFNIHITRHLKRNIIFMETFVGINLRKLLDFAIFNENKLLRILENKK